MTHENDDLEECVNGICKVMKRARGGAIKGAIRTVVDLVTPILVRSGDPRIVALGLGLKAARLAFLGQPKEPGK